MSKTEQLIELVKQNPCLYDHRDKYYKHISKKEMIWEQIAKELNQTSNVIRAKWKNLKDGYCKYKKAATCPSNKKKNYTNWVWGPHLEFLDDAIHWRQSQLLESSNSPEVNPETLEFQTVDVNMLSSDTLMQESEYNSSNQGSNRGLRKRRASSDQNTSEMDKILGYLIENERKDSTDLLFASYAKTMKLLKPRTQAAVKIKLSQIFAEAELEDLESDGTAVGRMLPVTLDNIKQDNVSDSDE